jgi:ribose transport system substrate-binding protein
LKAKLRLAMFSVAALMLSAALLAACGGGSSSSSEQTQGSTAETEESGSTAESEESGAAEREERLQADYEGVGMEVPPSGPTAVSGKKIWNVACTLAIPNCKEASDGVLAAGKALGWDVKTVDSESNPVKAGNFIMNAVTDKADGIVVGGIECAAIKSALTAAKAADIPVVGINGENCDPPLYTAPGMLIDGIDGADGLATTLTDVRSDWVIDQSEGDLKMLVMTVPDYTPVARATKKMEEDIASCSTCEIVDTVEIPLAKVGETGQLLSAALNANPDANTLWLYNGSAFVLGAGQAIERAGRATGSNAIRIASIGGVYGEPKLIHEGWDIGFVGYDLTWGGWQSADFLNRLLAGEEANELPKQGTGYQLVDSSNVESGDTWNPSIDYAAGYEEVWAGK